MSFYRTIPLMHVKCAICGYAAQVNPAVAGNGHRQVRITYSPPKLWICDIHVEGF
jgi:hypothetical protein